LRYFENMQWSARTAHKRLIGVCFVDYDREIVLTAVENSPQGESIAAVGRIAKGRTNETAEFSMIISDRWQRKGLGSEMMGLLLKYSRIEGIRRVVVYSLQENQPMRAVCRKFGFHESSLKEENLIVLTLDL
jgi:acetyltransferase